MRTKTKIKTLLACLFIASATVLSSLLPAPTTSATSYSDLTNINSQINAIKQKISAYEAEAKRLSAEANTLANQIEILKSEENALLAQIELSQAEHDRLVSEIEATQKRIDDNSELIGYTIAQYYYNSEISTIERLASSESFSSFVDEEAELSNFSDNLSSIVSENKTLKAELEGQKAEVARVLEDLSNQKAALESKRAEQQRLLEQTKGQEAAYQSLTSAAKSEKERLEAEQQRILEELANSGNASGMSPGDPNKGGYPYSGSCPSAKINNRQYADAWGMYVCECVSYVAWRVDNAYGNMPYWGGRGHANQWLSNARNAGIPTGSTPKVGAVGVTSSGPFGHVVWVEAVSGNRVYVSQYNYAIAAINYQKGEYSEMWVNASSYQYIYFGEW